MATFPFDPSPFLSVGCHTIELEGRHARHQVIHGNLVPANEDLTIATIIPMPQGDANFVNVREVLYGFF